jgi:predicted lipoprotein with Yx(FWY)xxD motif
MRPSIRHLLTVALAVGAAALVLAACGGGSGDDNGTATAAGSGVATVQSVDGTNVLADAEGRTLYTADVERSGIRCTEACTSFWDPVDTTASEAQSAAADLDLDLSTVLRPGGERQLTLDGLPLYTFTEEGPGQLDGDGFVDDFQGTHFEWAAATTGADSAPSGANAPSDSSPY